MNTRFVTKIELGISDAEKVIEELEGVIYVTPELGIVRAKKGARVKRGASVEAKTVAAYARMTHSPLRYDAHKHSFHLI
jgi:hypothetical protein